MLNPNNYWHWQYPARVDVNEQINMACTVYHRHFQQRPSRVVIPPHVDLVPRAGLEMQVNFFVPTNAFYFAKPGGGS